MPLVDAIADAQIVFRRLGRVPIILTLVWLLTVWWGESRIFRTSIAQCHWDQWETWHAGAQPHHVLLIADPQLVDPHTYPGRPWPLSSLTVAYTDLYLKRAYKSLLQQIQPHTTLFLGDLFDGGREWGVGSTYKSPVDDFKGIGMEFWLREYKRFMQMFVNPWQDEGIPILPSDSGRRFIASLPGNHDLGFAGGINDKVKSRFEAHFGPVNRMDLLGNHTFVSLDTVSLSAMDEIDRETGSSGFGDGTAPKTDKDKIWKPVDGFLRGASDLRDKAIRREVRKLDSLLASPELVPRYPKFKPDVKSDFEVSDVDKKLAKDKLQVATSQFPTILLSHVPLFRPQGASCGPHRERGTAIPLHAGYQYQNTLTPLISKDIIDNLDATQTVMIYSGDDHDYCEIEHDEFTGRIKEITVKSISWAMGIRKPGVQLVSLWNPVSLDSLILDADYDGRTILEQPSTPKGTVQNHLCLLPDQLSIFIHYGELLLLTLVILFVRACRYQPTSSGRDSEKVDQILPTYHTPRPRTQSPPFKRPLDEISTSSTSTVDASDRIRTTARKTQLGGYGNIPATSRSASPSKPIHHSQQGLPLISQAQNYPSKETDDWGMPPEAEISTRRHANVRWRRQSTLQRWFRPARSRVEAFAQSLVHIALPVLFFYFWLMWRS